ncbi:MULTISPECIES: transcriptional repressor [unclassified Streptomyces]|uniref:transcriptional repressor n=1 Tax=unclassified Streptomyces TaxID=2593676 RepID=UPI00339DCB51
MCSCTLTARAAMRRYDVGPRASVAPQRQGAYLPLSETRDGPSPRVLPGLRVLLRQRGLRCTPGRLHMQARLRGCGLHLSAVEVCARLEQAGEILHAASAYRTLEALTEAGLVHGVPCPGPMRYGITGEPHITPCSSGAGMSRPWHAST